MNSMMMRWTPSRLVTVMAFIALLAPGCGKIAEEATESVIEAGMPDGSKVEIDENGGNVTIQGADGSINMQTGESVALPADFPKDVPIPDAATWHMVQSAQAEGGSTVTVQGSVEADMNAVATSMKEKATAAGWESVSTYQQAGEAEMLTYKKGERSLSLAISKDGDKTSVLITSQ